MENKHTILDSKKTHKNKRKKKNKGHDNQCDKRWAQQKGIKAITSWEQVEEMRTKKFNETILQSIKNGLPSDLQDVSTVISDFLKPPPILRPYWEPQTVQKVGNLNDSKYGGHFLFIFLFAFSTFVCL